MSDGGIRTPDSLTKVVGFLPAILNRSFSGGFNMHYGDFVKSGMPSCLWMNLRTYHCMPSYLRMNLRTYHGMPSYRHAVGPNLQTYHGMPSCHRTELADISWLKIGSPWISHATGVSLVCMSLIRSASVDPPDHSTKYQEGCRRICGFIFVRCSVPGAMMADHQIISNR